MAKRNVQRELLSRGTSDHYEDAPLYDLEYADHRDDIAWYIEQAKNYVPAPESQSILELGAGTGRITQPLARAGFRVAALDRMPPMLAHLREKAGELIGSFITPIEGDIKELPFESATFPLVIAPFNVLMHLYTWSELLACFRSVHRVLQPDGIFALDVLVPDMDWLLWDANERHSVTKFRDPSTGRQLYYSTNHEYDHHTQICHIRIYYDEAPKREKPDFQRKKPDKTVHLAHRQIFPEELRVLLDTAGFEILRHEADFDRGPIKRSSDSQSVVARRRR
jgi:SAM-dependent methyltransferase